jgi:lipopolysaccharide/colanic/teichoic acid biosynthesis glycosyltransferase
MMASLTETQWAKRIWRSDVAKRQARPTNHVPNNSWYPAVKAIGEFGLALLLSVICAPVILIAGLLVKLTSRGPAFYTQIRLGLNGRPYTIFKLRTMTFNCEKLSGPQWSTQGDSRVTALGRLLRRSHLDELPQLWNVLRGDMSLIGPRPERPEFVPQLERALPHYRARLQVRPGVTGLAQVQLPPDTDLGSVRRKLAYDLYYVRQMGPLMDLRILVCTALKVLGVPFNFLSLLLWVPNNKAVENAAYGEFPFKNRSLPQMQPAI